MRGKTRFLISLFFNMLLWIGLLWGAILYQSGDVTEVHVKGEIVGVEIEDSGFYKVKEYGTNETYVFEISGKVSIDQEYFHGYKDRSSKWAGNKHWDTDEHNIGIFGVFILFMGALGCLITTFLTDFKLTNFDTVPRYGSRTKPELLHKDYKALIEKNNERVPDIIRKKYKNVRELDWKGKQDGNESDDNITFGTKCNNRRWYQFAQFGDRWHIKINGGCWRICVLEDGSFNNKFHREQKPVEGIKIVGLNVLDQGNGIKILEKEQGCRLKGYKILSGDMKSPYAGRDHKRKLRKPFNFGERLTYEVGEEYSVDKTDNNPSNTCGKGLHVARMDWCKRRARGWNKDWHIVEVSFDSEDVVTVPYMGFGKFRVKKFKVEKIVESGKEEAG